MQPLQFATGSHNSTLVYVVNLWLFSTIVFMSFSIQYNTMYKFVSAQCLSVGGIGGAGQSLVAHGTVKSLQNDMFLTYI